MSANTTPKQTRNLASAWQTTLTQPPPVNEWVVDVAFAEATKEIAPQFFVVELRYEVTRRCVAVRRFAEFRRLLKEVRRCELKVEAPFPSRTAILTGGLSGKPSSKALTRRLEGLRAWLGEVAAKRSSLDDVASKCLRQFLGAEDGWENDGDRPPLSPAFSTPPRALPPSPLDDDEDEQEARNASRLTAAALRVAELEGQRDAALLRCRELELEVANATCRASDAEQSKEEAAQSEVQRLKAELEALRERSAAAAATATTDSPLRAYRREREALESERDEAAAESEVADLGKAGQARVQWARPTGLILRPAEAAVVAAAPLRHVLLCPQRSARQPHADRLVRLLELPVVLLVEPLEAERHARSSATSGLVDHPSSVPDARVVPCVD